MRTQIMIFSIVTVLLGCSKSKDPNLPPTQPILLSPADGETCESLQPSFTWEASDPEQDDLTYTFWFGTTQDNLSIAGDNLQNPGYTLSQELNIAAKYYWQIEAYDGTSSTKSEINSFSTIGEGESGVLPSRPALIAPKADMPAGDVTFSWNASSAGTGTITYDLYIQQDAANGFSLLKEGIEGTSYTSHLNAGNLSWYVEAKDSRGQTTQSAVITITLN
ncbi:MULTISPECIES: hypothetical protein [Carboxylicivirga]|uniref:Fibronectin type-III domain-containing protein n=1 Tax=Carboxylicivirga mesophila TaxID=1166478 RepID=A0ABS5KF08_9BACT|nr:hypothetical protein [Carboxylicivirga mesophila]MBS2213106.1 hypothetical protein [Carboxylicivirga mesophila]